MPMFRKKPVVVEARLLTVNSLETVERWCNGSIKGTKLPRLHQAIDIQTLEGEMRANIGDWIIKGIKGEFYPCKADIFEQTYEAVERLALSTVEESSDYDEYECHCFDFLDDGGE